MTADKALDKNTKQCISTLCTILRFVSPSGKKPTAAVHMVNQSTYINREQNQQPDKDNNKHKWYSWEFRYKVIKNQKNWMELLLLGWCISKTHIFNFGLLLDKFVASSLLVRMQTMNARSIWLPDEKYINIQNDLNNKPNGIDENHGTEMGGEHEQIQKCIERFAFGGRKGEHCRP